MKAIINIDGADVPVKDFKLVGEPYLRDGQMFQDAEVTLLEPLTYFVVDLTAKSCPICSAQADPYGNLPCEH
jgi:hypothetical protein